MGETRKRGSVNTISFRPRSGIESWDSWPEDVRALLKQWNKERDLTFTRIDDVVGAYPIIFQCEVCHEWYRPSKNGVCVYFDKAMCDHCMVIHARASLL